MSGCFRVRLHTCVFVSPASSPMRPRPQRPVCSSKAHDRPHLHHQDLHENTLIKNEDSRCYQTHQRHETMRRRSLRSQQYCRWRKRKYERKHETDVIQPYRPHQPITYSRQDVPLQMTKLHHVPLMRTTSTYTHITTCYLNGDITQISIVSIDSLL